MSAWSLYTASGKQHTVTGELRVYRDFHSPQLNNQRDVLVWLPPDYESSDQRYPVIYMHDAQNLFDAHASYAGEWGVDETLTALHAEGLDAIVVGLPNMGERRALEYCPYPFVIRDGTLTVHGQGDDYLRFIVETVKPFIDAAYRTRPEPASTVIAGSSMGGLISLYGFLIYPNTFGVCGAFSTAYWFGDNSLLATTRERATGAGRVYLDVGTQEGPTLAGWNFDGQDLDAAYVNGVRDLHATLLERGYHDGTLRYVEAVGHRHNEPAWAARLPDALRFLLAETR